MDKYEFNIKVEQIKKLVNKGDYETAMKIADGIDWRRVRSTSLLASISQVYERNEEYQEAKDILLLAFERAPSGRGLLFKLTDLALREGNVPEAEAYYREFCELCGDDPRQNLLRYLILEAKKAPLDQLIVSLERYCQEELDEKWLYKLAELYQQAGREEDCVRICDKIMLLFGLGKYVDKAMELKKKYAPLTKYQMDLVENREKYEEKLRAVEEEYSSGRRIDRDDDLDQDFEPEEDEAEQTHGRRGGRRLDSAELHEAQAEQDLANEISKIPKEEYRDEEDSVGETRVLGDIRRMNRQPSDMQEQGGGDPDREAQAETGTTAGIRAVRTIQADKAAARADKEETGRQEGFRAGQGGAAAWAGDQLQGQSAAPQKDTDAYQAESAAAREKQMEQIARAYEEEEETIIEDWDLEPEESESNHLMIEADDPQSGLALALDSLKKIHRELGTKNPVAKISAQNLNKRGIFSVADRLVGKDLIVEHAADLDEFSIRDLSELMEADKSGMIVVLIDTPLRMERLHNGNPELADKFQYIGCRASERAEDQEEQEEKRRQAAASAEAARRQAEYEAEQERRRIAEAQAEEERRRAEYEAEAARKRAEQEELKRREEERQREEERRQAEIDAELERQRLAEYAAETARMEQAAGTSGEADREYSRSNDGFRQEDYTEESGYSDEEYDMAEDRRDDDGYQNGDGYYPGEGYHTDERPGSDYEDDYRDEDEEDGYQEPYEDEWDKDGHEDDYGEEGDDRQMDVEEFAQYACKYASEIDCSISGKSMLALYERAEMMEEDGIPLTRETAEDLIEEAADRAEKPSFGGFFSSKYDKDGLLILKEKHFFD